MIILFKRITLSFLSFFVLFLHGCFYFENQGHFKLITKAQRMVKYTV